MGKYKRKTDRSCLTQHHVEEARRLIDQGMSLRAAAKKIGVKESTLRKRRKLVSVLDSTLFKALKQLKF